MSERVELLIKTLSPIIDWSNRHRCCRASIFTCACIILSELSRNVKMREKERERDFFAYCITRNVCDVYDSRRSALCLLNIVSLRFCVGYNHCVEEL